MLLFICSRTPRLLLSLTFVGVLSTIHAHAQEATAAQVPDGANQVPDGANVNQANVEASASWPLPRGNAESTGAVDITLPDELDVVWEFKADEAVESSPVVASGRVFVADVMGKLYAIDAKTGKEIWSKDFDTGFLASPAIHAFEGLGELVVIGDVEGNIYVLETETGVERWRRTTDGEIDGSAGFFENSVLVTSQDGKLYAFDAKNGEPLWTYQTDDQVRCNPTIAGGQTFLGGCDGQLHRVDLRTGKAIGETLALGGPTGSTAAVVGDRAVVPIMDGAVLAFDWKKGESLWRYEDPERPQEYRGSAAVTDSVAVVTSRNKFVDALDLATGKQIWRHTLRRRSDASPVIAGKDVWIAATDGRLIRLSLETGEERWTYEIRGSFLAAPAIVGQHLIIPDDDGVVRAFGAKRS